MKKTLKMLAVGALAVTALPLTTFAQIGEQQPGQVQLYSFDKTTGAYDFNKPIQHNMKTDGTGQDVFIPETAQAEKAEFRSAWTATVLNLDFLTNMDKGGITEEVFKAEFEKLIDAHVENGFNAMIFQVRPKLDAWYPSELNPWSEYLVGTQGATPAFGDFDPMAYMVERTHEAGIEFHAWFNPYRVSNNTGELDDLKTTEQIMSEQKLADTNFAVQNQDLTFKFAGKVYLNPGEPAVQDYVVDSVMEVVEKYDIDGVHFDDYFYPYKSSGLKYVRDENGAIVTDENGNWVYEKDTAGKPVKEDLLFEHFTIDGTTPLDQATYEKYGNGMEINDWRRHNIDTLIERLNNEIDAHNEASDLTTDSYVKLGISPFGIWGHASHPETPEGSDTPLGSTSSYLDFVDTKKWVENEWLDYVIPQIYWSFQQTAAPYAELVDWWANTVEGTDVQLYIGHANYKYYNTWDSTFGNPEEIINQIRFNSMYDTVKGSAFFALKDFVNDRNPNCTSKPDACALAKEAAELVKAEYLAKPAIMPVDPTQAALTPDATPVFNVQQTQTQLTWEDTATSSAKAYLIYAVNEASGDVTAVENLVGKVTRNGATQLSYELPETTTATHYYVSAVNGASEETEAVSTNNVPTFVGVDDVTLERKTSFDALAGVTATDIEDGDLTAAIVVNSKKVNVNKPGTYEVSYSVTDADGNETTVIRQVTILEKEKPNKN